MSEHIVKAPHVPPFVTFVTSAVPMVFDNSLSYYEALCALWKWLQDDVVNVINNNATVTEEYINLTNELKTFVDDYFDNLDVQEEINNKLDQMVEDGTLQEIVADYLEAKVAWCFDTVADMKAATNLVSGSYAQTLGFTTLNDGGAAIYKIRNKASGENPNENNIIAIGSTLVAELINNEIINHLKQPNTSSYTLSAGKTLEGCHSKPINAGDEDNVILVEDQNVTIKDVTITNTNNLSYKNAIKTYKSGGNTSSLTINNTFIGDGFEKGVLLDGAYFSSFSNLKIGDTTNASLTLDNSQGNWTGVQNFRDCVFHSGNPTVLINETDTNTIAFDNCCFEDVTNNVIDNKGKVYFNNTYFGDMVSTNKETHILKARSGSQTYFNNCTIALNPALNSEGSFNSYFDLNNSKCYVNGGLIYAGNRQHQSATYTSSNANDLIFIDNLRHNEPYNWTPYYLYSYTPLRSLNPMQNFVINGNLTDNLQNAIGFEYNNNTYAWNISTDYVNPFGGKLMQHTQAGTFFPYVFYYELPDEYVGKEIKLQAFGYCKRLNGDTSTPFIIASDTITEHANLTGSISYAPFNPYSNNSEFDERNVFAVEISVYSKTKRGKIRIRYQDGGSGLISISGLALLDKDHSLQMGTFKCADKRASDHVPTNTSNAVKGDFVYNFADNATCEGWIFNGTSWSAVNTY